MIIPLKAKVFILTLCLCISCKNAVNILEIENNDTDIIQNKLMSNEFPIVNVKIEFEDTSFKETDEFIVRITLTNKRKQKQNLLFDKPEVSTGGPWSTIASVIDSKTNESVLKHQNKAILSSKLYSEEELKSHYYSLKPNQTITREFKLRDIVVFNTEGYNLPKGKYIVKLSYYFNCSNSLPLIIE